MGWKVAGGDWQLLVVVVKCGGAQHLLIESKHSWWPRGPILNRAEEYSCHLVNSSQLIMFQSQALTSVEAQTVARALEPLSIATQTHLCVAIEAHVLRQHCGREQGLGPSCVAAPLGSVFPSLEGVPHLVQTVLVPVTCGGCYVLTYLTAC